MKNFKNVDSKLANLIMNDIVDTYVEALLLQLLYLLPSPVFDAIVMLLLCWLQWSFCILWRDCRTGSGQASTTRDCDPTCPKTWGDHWTFYPCFSIIYVSDSHVTAYCYSHAIRHLALYWPEGSSTWFAFIWPTWKWENHAGKLNVLSNTTNWLPQTKLCFITCL